MASLLDGKEPPTAVFVASRGLLPGVLQELGRRSMRVPDDISLAVWGDPGLDPSAIEAPHVTYVTWSAEKMGRLAIRAFEEVVRSERSERMVIRVGTWLLDRGSVANIGLADQRKTT